MLKDFVEELNDGEPRPVIGDRGETADIGIPQHRADAFNRAALDCSRMHAPSRIVTKIGGQQAGGDAVRRIALNG